MYQHTLRAAELAPPGAILALRSEMAAAAVARAPALDRMILEALERTCGRGNWTLYWDEDLAGRPIRGTVSLAWGDGETLVIG